MCVAVYAGHMCASAHGGKKRTSDIRSPGAGVASSCELLRVGAESELQSSGAANVLNHQAISTSLDVEHSVSCS